MTHPGEYDKLILAAIVLATSGEVVAMKRRTRAVGMSLSLQIEAETDYCR